MLDVLAESKSVAAALPLHAHVLKPLLKALRLLLQVETAAAAAYHKANHQQSSCRCRSRRCWTTTALSSSAQASRLTPR